MTPIQEEKKKNKKEQERIKEEIKKPIKKVKIDVDPKIEKKGPEEEKLAKKIIQIKEEEILKKEEREEELTDEEKRILLVLNFVDRHKGGLSITGFQLKDFLELIFPSWDVDEIYSLLKKKEFISKARDSDEFSVPYKGKHEAEKHEDLMESLFKVVGAKLEEFLKKNELLKRILYFANKDEWRLRNFLSKISYKLDELEQVLMTFFLDGSFLEIPVVSKTIRLLRKEQPSQIKDMLMDYSKDLDFLKVLAILMFDKIEDKIGIETITTLYYKSHLDILSEIVEKSKAEEILEKLLLLGITETEDLFGVDVEAILASEENISRLKEWLAFDEDAFKNQLENDWNLFINAKIVLESMTPFDFEDLVNTKAVLFYKNNILVRKEVKDAFVVVYEKVREKLKNKIKEIENVLIVPFYEIEREKLKELKGKIIIILHVVDWWSKKYYHPAIREDDLENNVILLISPKEIGFSMDKEKLYFDKKSVLELPENNVEFNAMGKIDNLEQVKSKFKRCNWIVEEEHQSVKRARELIEDKKIPKISFEDVLEEIKRDEILTRMLFLVSKLYSHNKYYQPHFWSDVRYNIISQFEISAEKFEELKKKFVELIEKRMKSNFEIFYGKNLHNKCKEELVEQVLRNIYELDENSKKSLYIFLLMNFERLGDTYLPEERTRWFSKFKAYFQFLFCELFSKNLFKFLLRLGLIYLDTWITWSNNDHGSFYNIVDFFNEIKSRVLPTLKETLKIKYPNIEEFIKKYKDNVIELIGLDYLLHSDGLCRRDELKEILWKISLEAWKKFESYEGVISSKDSEFITVNPLILDELKKFVNASKREMIESQERLKEVILFLEIIDSMIKFDEDLFILKGFITLRNMEEIKIIITPWYLPLYEKYLGEKALIIITNQPDYNTLVKTLESINKEITLIFLKNHQFYLYSKFREIYFVNSLLTKLEEYDFALISKEIIPLETLEELIVKQEPITPQVEKEESNEISDGEELDLFGELFDTDLKGFPIGLGTEDPVVLILSKTEDDDYSATLQIMCRELYRELIKGLPRPKRITEEKVEEETDVSDKIIFIDEDKAEKLGLGKISTFKDVRWINLGKKLQEFFSRYFGFYIFEIPSNKMEEFKKKLEKYTKDLRPRIIQVFPILLGRRKYLVFAEEGIKEIPDLVEIKKKICSIIWGFVIPQRDDRWEQGDTFDNFFTSCENEYKNRLRTLEIQKIKVEGKEISVPNLVKTVKPESDIHFQIKIFIVKYLYEIEKYSKDSIRTEQKIDNGEIYPDVQVGNVFFEVETLHNSERPRIKIAEKVKNYKNKGKKVIIVLKNVDVFLYYKYLIDLEEELKEEENIDVELKTLNLKDNVLVHIKEIGKSYRSLFKKNEFKKSS